jgi:CRISPR-associated protein Cmx8
MFKAPEKEMKMSDGGDSNTSSRKEGEAMTHEKNDRALTRRVHHVIRAYVRQRAEKRAGRTWKQFEESGYKDGTFREAMNKVCMDAFYQIRSRHDRRDFLDYWSGTICSVPQWRQLRDYEELEQMAVDLLDEDRWEDVQSLALLSLSAHSQPDVKADAADTK